MISSQTQPLPPELVFVATDPVTLDIGGFRIRLVPERGAGLGLYRPYEAFVMNDAGPIDCEVACGWGIVEPGGEVMSQRREWEVRIGPDGGEQVVFFMPTESGRAAFLSLSIDAGAVAARVVRDPKHPGGESLPVGFPWDEFLVSRLAARSGRLIVHGSSIVADGLAWVFVGHSGAGKSTIARIAEEDGGVVLSDDRTVLGLVGGKVMAHGTPWHGTHRRGRPDSAEVGGVFLLNQAHRDEIVPITAAAAFGELFVRLVLPMSDRSEIEGASAALGSMIERVEVSRLDFRPSVEAFRLVRGRSTVLPPSGIRPARVAQ